MHVPDGAPRAHASMRTWSARPTSSASPLVGRAIGALDVTERLRAARRIAAAAVTCPMISVSSIASPAIAPAPSRRASASRSSTIVRTAHRRGRGIANRVERVLAAFELDLEPLERGAHHRQRILELMKGALEDLAARRAVLGRRFPWWRCSTHRAPLLLERRHRTNDAVLQDELHRLTGGGHVHSADHLADMVDRLAPRRETRHRRPRLDG